MSTICPTKRQCLDSWRETWTRQVSGLLIQPVVHPDPLPRIRAILDSCAISKASCTCYATHMRAVALAFSMDQLLQKNTVHRLVRRYLGASEGNSDEEDDQDEAMEMQVEEVPGADR